MAYYVLDPAALRSSAPEKYDLIKTQVFNGQEFVEGQWPQLAETLEQTGGLSDLLRSCVDHADEISTFTDTDGSLRASFFAREDHDASKPMTYFKLDSSACFSEKAEAIASKVAELCQRGGLPALQEEIHRHASDALQELQKAVTRALTSSQQERDQDHRDCVAEKNLASRCSIEKEIGRAVAESSLLSTIRPEQLQGIVHSVAAKAFISNPWGRETRDLQAAYDPREVFLLCMNSTSDDRVLRSGDELIMVPSDCAKAADARVVQDGWQFDSETARTNASYGLPRSPEVSHLLDSFRREVYPEVGRRARLCLFRSSCRTNKAREVITDWAQAHGFDLNSEATRAFIEKLSRLVR
jgi:hypothetical protein